METTMTVKEYMDSMRARVAAHKARIFAYCEGDAALAADLRKGEMPWLSHAVYAQGVDYALTYKWMREWAGLV